MLFANPVRGTIHPLSWQRPPANHQPKVTQWFGCTGFSAEPPFGDCRHFHRGLDISTKTCGPDVLAAADGKVVRSFVDDDGARVVAIRHAGGWASIYVHMAHRNVQEGDRVTAGDVVGPIGDTGNATACHLHFGLKSDLGPGESPLADHTGRWRNPWTHLEQNT